MSEVTRTSLFNKSKPMVGNFEGEASNTIKLEHETNYESLDKIKEMKHELECYDGQQVSFDVSNSEYFKYLNNINHDFLFNYEKLKSDKKIELSGYAAQVYLTFSELDINLTPKEVKTIVDTVDAYTLHIYLMIPGLIKTLDVDNYKLKLLEDENLISMLSKLYNLNRRHESIAMSTRGYSEELGNLRGMCMRVEKDVTNHILSRLQ